MGAAKGRVAVTTFASHVGRLRAVAEAALASDREVVVVGRAMQRVAGVARELGYFDGLPPFRDEEAFGYLGLDWEQYVRIDERYFRPNEVDFLLADSSKAREVIEWEPRVKFADLVRVMVDADLEMAGVESPGEGRKILEAHHGEWHRWESQVVG